MRDLLLASVLYSHFRSEHLRVHHLWVGTPRDPVTARYNEGFHRFFPRVLLAIAALGLEGREGDAGPAGTCPRHTAAIRSGAMRRCRAGFLLLALALGGWIGLGLFLWQAFVAIWQLELVNYIEHYGLTRRASGQGQV